ncbi:WXG100 family type VII secretion target [Nocardia sp. NPDC050717]|uniref:WXG100 family type VII secretion target n=1 Tax=Nocardia sp. NPDC050717 TaxID=3157221 RepID=UPI00340B3684
MTGTEPVQIPPATEIPLCWTHKGILNAFEQVATEPANGAATKYRESGTKWTNALEQFRQRMQVSIASAWEGDSATASVNAIRQYTSDADKLTPAFTAMSDQVTAAAAAAVKTKSALPGEVDPGFLDSMPWNKAVVRGQREDAEDDARDVMGNQYVLPFSGTDNSIPVLPRPTNPTQSTEDPGGSTVTDNTNGDGNQPGTNDGTQPAQTTDTENPEAETPSESSPTEDPSSSNPTSTEEDDSTDTAGTNNPTTDSPSTSPAATNPATTNQPTGLGSGSGGGSGVPGGAGGSPGTGSPVAPKSGTALPGGLAASAPAAAAAAAGAGSAGSRGMTGMPGMMGAGAGRGKDDESEHKIPDYLITEANASELIGDLPPAVRGGVLGSHFPAANPPRTDDRASGGT